MTDNSSAMTDEQLYKAYCEAAFGQIHRKHLSDYNEFAKLSPGAQIVAATEEIEYQVSNGGLSQLFWNDWEVYQWLIPAAIQAYADVGAAEQAEALQKALAVFESHKETFVSIRFHGSISSSKNSEAWQDAAQGLYVPQDEWPFFDDRFDALAKLKGAYLRSLPTSAWDDRRASGP